MSEFEEPSTDEGRRGFIKKAAYVAPLILTLNVMPAHATYGSQKTLKRFNLKKRILKRKLPVKKAKIRRIVRKIRKYG